MKSVQIIGAPLDLGGNRRGVDMGPSALRIAGLGEQLRALGYDVADRGDLAAPIRDLTAWHRLKVDRDWLGLWFMLPAAAFLLLFLAYPLGLGIWLSFTDARIGRGGNFIGLENYEWLWDDSVFWLSVYRCRARILSSNDWLARRHSSVSMSRSLLSSSSSRSSARTTHWMSSSY